jgi:hypothetical protein
MNTATHYRFHGLGDDGTDSSGAFINLPAYNPAADTTNPFTPILTSLSSGSGAGSGAGGGGGATLSSMLPVLLIGGGLLLVMMMAGRK